ncbi:uncharacterized protein LOC129795431 [Lutzomyia longipalpis]|uniref:uncharacterized protein LOC129795431 n=1 Tax=Lutzomyia longipalpis TaxID=7200 RepID=UPI00248331B4|nr:uncharacterized protein LOC129795431 [Lutzomyia longipalpis]
MRMFWVKIHFVVLLNVLHSGCEILTESETPEREIFLQPRHFNPHPFESTNRIDRQIQPASTSIFNQGPIQFPPTNQDVPPGGRPNHPYAVVAQRNRQKSLQRFAGIDNNVLPTAYVPLARHPKKFLPDRRYDYEDIYDDYSSHKKQYAFSYSVKDDFSHSQQQKDGTVRGSYKVHLPDGRIQIVRYHADDNGYHADVSYNEGKPLPPPLPPPRPTFNYLKGFHADHAPPEGPQPRNFNYNLYIGQPPHASATPAPSPIPTIPTYGDVHHSVPGPNVHIQSYNTAAEVSARSTDIAPTTPATIIQPTSYYLKSTTLPAPRISFLTTTPASPYQDITVVGANKLQASLNPYGARKATAIDPTGNYEYGNSAPSSTYATNYDYDYDSGYRVSGISSTEAAAASHQAHEVNNLDSNGVALYYQAEK